jgi:geranylgeranyl diphosphate synthase, type II
MYSITEIKNIIDEEIKKLSFGQNPKELYDPVKYFLEIGGKRIRPMLTLLSCNLFSGKIEKAVKPALGIEIFHNFTLLHDDIMDNSPIRRNKQTVHTKWNNNVAILSGDAMMIKSFEYFYDCEPDILKDVLVAFNKNALQVCEGQQYDMNYEKLDNISLDEYLKMIELKTSVLIGGSLKIGAILGGAAKYDIQQMYEFGKNLGIAFQLQDDYLDVYGDVKVFGKKIGVDIVSNKKTFLLISALNLAEGKVYENLIDLMKNKEISNEEKISSITGIFNILKINELILNRINEYFNLAFSFFEKVNVEEDKKLILKNFALSLLNRES